RSHTHSPGNPGSRNVVSIMSTESLLERKVKVAELTERHQMNPPKANRCNFIGRPSRRQRAGLVAGSILAGIYLAVNSVSAQSLMVFNFNEGTGTNVTSADGKLVGTFVGTPTFTNDTPSGLEGDFALQFAAGQRVTVPDPNKILALDPAKPDFTI